MPRRAPSTIVYSALFGNIDEPPPSPKREVGVGYVLFTDRKLKVPGWRVVQVQPRYAPRLQARALKVHSMERFPKATHTVWIDANVRLRISIVELLELVGDSNIAATNHPDPDQRDCLYDEAKVCLLLDKGDPARLQAQVEFYRQKGIPEHLGLAATGMLVRSHQDVVQSFESYWWAHITRFSLRDQVSFPVALRQAEEAWKVLDPAIIDIEAHSCPDPARVDWKTTPGAVYTPVERELTRTIASIDADQANPAGRVLVCIGVMWGATMHCLRAGDARAALYGVDLDYTTAALKGDPQAVLIQGRSQEIHEAFDLPIHVLMIDGAHDYHSVKGDIDGWVPKIPVGGHVIFHDYAPAACDLGYFPEIVGVKQAVDEWKNESWVLAGMADSTVAYRRLA